MLPSFVRALEQKGTKRGKRLVRLKENIDKPLAAILTLNTIAHTVGAAGVGAQASFVFGNEYFGIISAVLTLLILFFSEIIPKTLGAIYWKELAGFTAVSCHLIIIALFPFVWVSERLTSFIQPKGERESVVKRDELVALAHLGLREGVIAESENKIILNLIRFRKIQVDDIMTPRTVVGKLPESMTCGEALKQKSMVRFSRILVHAEDQDEITGYVLKQQLLEEVAFGRELTLISELKRSITIAMEHSSLSNLFRDMFNNREQIALVVDEYGAMSGLVTKEDLIETLLGFEIMDEFDQVEDMREFARKKWKERAQKMDFDFPE